MLPLESVPDSIGQLKNLSKLYLRKNQISHLSTVSTQCLPGSQLKNIFKAIEGCLKLSVLDVSVNRLVTLPSEARPISAAHMSSRETYIFR